ncbi:YkgJ family cysteine cluster protein [Capilliphycus salinus ALCB114379]|uniref:YkgJ family cysteine cluster protein n=1 Tax=Capilliphycus salinus TaxID=2768948 RepID=UPI0039A586E9
MATWQCVKNCGACCYLEPSERPELDEYLDSEDLELYLSLVGEDGWCIHYNAENRDCSIYPNRPRFCRVQPDVFEEMFGIESEELNDFAIDCCHQQIESVYGDDSPEMKHFNDQVGFDEEAENLTY